MSKRKFITLFFVIFFGISLFNINSAFSYSIPVTEVFSDIKSNYKYINELQTLYDKGMIFPDKEGKFNPKALLNRDEFVGILEEVTCKKCISPFTSYDLLKKYEDTNKLFFDIKKNNKYFYCVADATDYGYVNGYQAGTICEDGTKKDGEKPFCPNNTIILEEALSIILKASGILSNQEADKIRNDISKGYITEKLSLDVYPKNNDGSVYSFYPDFQKALNYSVVDVDKNGKVKVLKLINIVDGKIRPKQSITKEDFLKMAYVALKANSCIDKQENNIPIRLIIKDSKCLPNDENCTLTSLSSTNNIYDYTLKYFSSCDKGVLDPQGYIWRYYNNDTGQEVKKYGKYIDNFQLLEKGNWTVFVRVVDNCGNTGEVYSSLKVIQTIFDKSKVVENNSGYSIFYYGNTNGGNTNGGNTNGGYNNGGNTNGGYNNGGYNNGGYNNGGNTNGGNTNGGNTNGGNTNGGNNNGGNTNGGNTNGGNTNGGNTNGGNTNGGYNNGGYNIGGNTNGGNNNGGNNNSVLSIYITSDLINGLGPLTVNFDTIVYGTSNNTNYTYNWDFGDGNTSYGNNTKNVFKEPGIYLVTLNVYNNSGEVGKSTLSISVDGMDLKKIDSDLDGVNDSDDLCPLIKGSNINKGCPIYEEQCNEQKKCREGSYCTDGGFCKPNILSSSCEYSGGDIIFGNSICNSCPCDYSLDFISKLRKCDLIFPAIVSPDNKDIYSRGNFFQIKK